MPTVFTPPEAKSIIAELEGTTQLIVSLVYGSGMHLTEVLRLRVKDIDFELMNITVRDGKGEKDRITMLPVSLVENLQIHLERVKLLHQQNPAKGFGEVWLP